MEGKNILVIDDEEFIRMNLKNIFESDGYNVDLCENGSSGIEALNKNDYDLAFLDINLPDSNGLDILRQIRSEQPNLLVIIITGFASIESAVKALKLGAYEYIKKPFKADAIKLITKLALETQKLKAQVKKLESQTRTPLGIDSIIGESQKIKEIKSLITEYAKYDTETVLITGESGVGKELIASSIHKLSPRSDEPFIEINCASIPDNLLESELFGHERGAFTDAREKKIGLFETANGGTLFLDEIGDMSLNLQAKILRVLENNKLRRLGSNRDIKINVRTIAATNKNLQEAIESKEFRKDLYYRLNVLRVEIPPLRERGKDVLLLANYYMNIYNIKFTKQIESFSDEAKNKLLRYNWPGNVRELKNVIERACILQRSSIIETQNLHLDDERRGVNTLSDFIESEIDFNKINFENLMNEFERMIIKKAMKECNGNVSETARILNIPRETLRYKISKYQIISHS